MRVLLTYNLECVVDNADSHKLLSVVATVHHEGVGETLNDWALCLPEALLGVTSSRVGGVDWCTDLNVITIARCQPVPHSIMVSQCAASPPSNQRVPAPYGVIQAFDITHVKEMSRIYIDCQHSCRVSVSPRSAHLNILVAPLVEELDGSSLSDNVLWKDWVGGRSLNFDLSGVRHDCGDCRSGDELSWKG